MASGSRANAAEIDRHATALAKDPASKAFIPLAEEYGKAGMWAEAAGVLEDGLKYYPGFITAMVALGRAYDQLGQPTKAKAILEEAIKISPENLRAHRTLAKIYTAEGSTALALRSCDVILALNPLDQESLSLRASLGATNPTISGTPTPPSQDRLVASSRPATEVPLPPMPAAAALATPDQEAVTALSASETATPDIVASATASMASALGMDQTPALDPALAHTKLLTEPVAEQTPTPSPSRNQATTSRLEHLLQSIQMRRRDLPSPETTPTSS